jgi:hypothetical protein
MVHSLHSDLHATLNPRAVAMKTANVETVERLIRCVSLNFIHYLTLYSPPDGLQKIITGHLTVKIVVRPAQVVIMTIMRAKMSDFIVIIKTALAWIIDPMKTLITVLDMIQTSGTVLKENLTADRHMIMESGNVVGARFPAIVSVCLPGSRFL